MYNWQSLEGKNYTKSDGFEMFEDYMRDRIYGYLWKNFNMEKIDEPYTIHVYFTEVIKRLIANAYRNLDLNVNTYLRKKKLEQRKLKLGHIFNLSQD